MQEMRYKNSLIAGFLFIECLAAGVFFLEDRARRVAFKAAKLDRNARLEFEAVNLSTKFGIYFKYKVIRDSELTKIYWRLFPFDAVDVEK